MAELVVVYWRDIPAQIIVKKGRKAVRRELPLRFTEAIDRCAMKVGASDTDAYLAQWRRGTPVDVSDDLETEADRAFACIEKRYDSRQLKSLVEANGWNDGIAED